MPLNSACHQNGHVLYFIKINMITSIVISDKLKHIKDIITIIVRQEKLQENSTLDIQMSQSKYHIKLNETGFY